MSVLEEVETFIGRKSDKTTTDGRNVFHHWVNLGVAVIREARRLGGTFYFDSDREELNIGVKE